MEGSAGTTMLLPLPPGFAGIEPGAEAEFAYAEDVARPPALRLVTSTLSLETVINAKQNLDLSTDILMDGSATLEVEYL